MTAIVNSIDIARTPEQVFAYATDPRTFPEWQQGVTSGKLDGATTRVGTHCTTVRKIGGSEREVTTEITEFDPPRRWSDHGISGPIRAVVSVSVEPTQAEAGARITISVDFVGHGIGKLLVPLFVRRAARTEMPGNMQRLKLRLEGQP